MDNRNIMGHRQLQHHTSSFRRKGSTLTIMVGNRITIIMIYRLCITVCSHLTISYVCYSSSDSASQVQNTIFTYWTSHETFKPKSLHVGQTKWQTNTDILPHKKWIKFNQCPVIYYSGLQCGALATSWVLSLTTDFTWMIDICKTKRYSDKHTCNMLALHSVCACLEEQYPVHI